MSKWRPTEAGCLYVIPDIHGAHTLLERILKRILPLRSADKIIFLGDYIDRHIDGHLVIDRLMELKKQYDEQIVFLAGNHEIMALESLKAIPMARSISSGSQSVERMRYMWLVNGGNMTIAGYLERAGIEADPFTFPGYRLTSIIPQSHIDFMMDLDAYYEQDNYLFIHGGCDPERDISTYSAKELSWDRGLMRRVMYMLAHGKPLTWDKVIVTGHNGTSRDGIPIIADKFMMLDCGSPKRLLVVELNSMEAFMSLPKRKRLVKFQLKETAVRIHE